MPLRARFDLARDGDCDDMSFFNSIGRSMGIAPKSKGRPGPMVANEPPANTGITEAAALDLPLGAAPKPLYLCQPFVRSTLIKGSFRTIVALPKYVHPYEWIAMNCASTPLTQCLTFSTT